MPETFIPGHLAVVTINAEDLTLIGSVFRLNLGKTVTVKKHFGSTGTDRISGKRDVTFSASGNIAAEKMAALNTMYESLVPVAFSLQIGEAAGATDAGLYNGLCVIGTLSLEVDADGDWAWSLDAGSHGTVTYTPANES
jgi:hypothetical protein